MTTVNKYSVGRPSNFVPGGALVAAEVNSKRNGRNVRDHSPDTPKAPHGLGDFFKRFSPKYRSRSKSPASQQQQQQRCASEKCWVTVEIKDEVDRRAVTAEDCSKSACSSPSTPLLRNGFGSPEKSSPRFLGGLFHRGHGAKTAPSELSRSQHELNEKRLVSPAPFQHPLGSDLARVSATSARSALSEENLVSKSLADDTERLLMKPHPELSTLAGISGVYHSQDSVFDARSGRVPSYVRISCTLNGYKNYRGVDLRRASGTCAKVSSEGKSIVERRLEKFQQTPPAQQQQQQQQQSTPITTTTASIEKKQNGIAQADDATYATPIKDIIKNFNNLTINSDQKRPKPTPPPVPPKLMAKDEEETGKSTDRLPSSAADVSSMLTHTTTEAAVNHVVPESPRLSTQMALSTGLNGHRLESDDGHVVNLNNDICGPQMSEEPRPEAPEVSAETPAVDGTYYRALAAEQRSWLERVCAEAEEYLTAEDLPEEAAERVRMVVGKVKLLLRKKFAKFEELIESNLNPVPDNPQPTLVADLEGYFHLVKIEIDEIDRSYQTVRLMRDNHWQLPFEEPDSGTRSKPAQRVTKPVQQRSVDDASSATRAAAAKERLREAKAAALRRKEAASVQQDAAFLNIEPPA